MNSKTSILLTSLQTYFKNPNKLQVLINVRNHQSGLTPRLLDWFVVIYSRKHPVYINEFHIYESYKNALKSYGKQFFDPFCRVHKIIIKTPSEELVQTSISQLNFIRWAIDTQVIPHIEKNIRVYLSEMNSAGLKEGKVR